MPFIHEMLKLGGTQVLISFILCVVFFSSHVAQMIVTYICLSRSVAGIDQGDDGIAGTIDLLSIVDS